MSVAPEQGGTMIEIIAADLRTQIHDGMLSPGERVGSVKDLAERYGAARTTVHAAIDLLIGEGILSGGKGLSLRVRQAPEPLAWDLGAEIRAARDGGAGDWWEDAVRQQGHDGRQDAAVLSFLAAPPPEMARAPRWDGKTAVRSLTRWVDGKPSMLAAAYFPYPVIAGTPLAEPGDVPAAAEVLAGCGHPQSRLECRATARMPRPLEVAGLRLPRGVPVLEVTLDGYEAGGAPVHVVRIVAPADRWAMRLLEPA